SAVICVLLFPKIFVVTGFSILIISDSASALFGRKFGRHKFLAKSLEGALAFFISALIVVAITPKIEYLFLEYLIGIVGAAVGTIVESYSSEIDDNISIPVSICLVMWGLYSLFLPTLNVYKYL
ncbi:MAG: dolichol kinase, partial [Ignavibacteria bacterium]|nr:dolichol kinase [Ignavibacteria bacterium]